MLKNLPIYLSGTIMTSPYILQDTVAVKASYEKTFVYILKLNAGEEKANKPFYIGSTKNVAQKFSRDKVADWHYEYFGKPVIVEIIGSVPDSHVEQAEKDLKVILVNGGCIILSKMITSGKAESYLRSRKPIFYDLTPWVEHHEARTSSTVTKPVKDLDTIKKFTVEDIVKEIAGYDFLDTDSLNFALYIARKFNPETGCAKIVFEDVKNKEDVKRLQTKLNKIKFIWNPQYKLKAYTVNEYRLTKPTLQKIQIRKNIEDKKTESIAFTV